MQQDKLISFFDEKLNFSKRVIDSVTNPEFFIHNNPSCMLVKIKTNKFFKNFPDFTEEESSWMVRRALEVYFRNKFPQYKMFIAYGNTLDKKSYYFYINFKSSGCVFSKTREEIRNLLRVSFDSQTKQFRSFESSNPFLKDLKFTDLNKGLRDLILGSESIDAQYFLLD